MRADGSDPEAVMYFIAECCQRASGHFGAAGLAYGIDEEGCVDQLDHAAAELLVARDTLIKRLGWKPPGTRAQDKLYPPEALAG